MPTATLEDLAQETYLVLWAKLPSYRGDSRLETWACGFAFNQFRRWQSANYRNRHEPLVLSEEPGVDAQLPNDSAEVIRSILDGIGSPAEDVVRMKHFEGLTFEVIASKLGISSNTAKSQYYRCLSRLRENLRVRSAR